MRRKQSEQRRKLLQCWTFLYYFLVAKNCILTLIEKTSKERNDKKWAEQGGKKIFLTTINNEEELCILKTVKRKKEKKSLNAKSFPIIFLLLGSFSTRFCLSNRAAAARGRFSLCESIKHTQTARRKARDEFYVKKRTKPSRTKHYIFNVIWIFIELLKVLGCYQREKRHKMSKKASKRFFY